jgi:hypothetical protein
VAHRQPGGGAAPGPTADTLAISGVPEEAWNELAGAMHIIGSFVLILWLVLGAIAAGQRGDYTNPPANCSQVGTVAVTILAGPLNWLGVNPKISCHLPPPSK